MSKLLCTLHVGVMLLVSTVAWGQDEKAVRSSFDNYKSAILNDRGEEAVQYIDSRTIQYYADVLEKVKLADSATVEGLSLLDKLMVFSIRHRTSKEEIMSFNGTSLLVYAIKSGMVGKNSVANNTIGDVTIDGSFAKGQFLVNKQKAPFFLHFYKEDNAWKIDLTSLFAISGMAFKKMVTDSGKTEDEFLFDILEMLTGKKPGPEIWVPTAKTDQ